MTNSSFLLRVNATLLFALAFITCAHGQGKSGILSELLPSKTYQVEFTKTVSGNDGFKDIVPRVATQTFRIETGAMEGNRFPATLKIYEIQNDKSARRSAPLFMTVQFTVSQNGEFSDFSASDTKDKEASLAPKLNTYQHMEGILLMTKHPLERKRKLGYAVTKTSPAGKGNLQSVEFTVKDESGLGVESPNLLKTRTGKAMYDPANKFFVESNVVETSRIAVPGDADNKAKEVLMVSKMVYKIDIKDKK